MTSIRFSNVTFAYRDASTLFRELTLDVNGPTAASCGHVVAVMGPSGTGKTTLLRLICGIETATRGSILLSPEHASVSYLQQQPVLFEHLSRLDNARYFSGVQKTKERFSEELFARLTKKLKLASVLESRSGIDTLSGGERQRLALLRALAVKPNILLLDEPCSGLDADVKVEMLSMLREIVDELKLLALYVTHHSDEAELVADQFLYLHQEEASCSVSASMLPVLRSLAYPPTLHAARTFMDLGANVIECVVDNRGLISVGDSKTLGRLAEGQFQPGSYLLVFSPKSVRWTSTPDGRLRLVGQSACHTFASASFADTVIGPRGQSFSSFHIEGAALLFHRNGGAGAQVNIMRPKHQI